MKRHLLLILMICLSGMIYAQFSVSPTTTVEFSSGNLQYCAALDSFRFAQNQWDVLGEENEYIVNLSNNTHWIDLFGWATSGYDNTAVDPLAFHFRPWEWYCELEKCVDWEKNQFAFGPSTNMPDQDLVGTSARYDWGVNNADQLGAGWRTLTEAEWKYLLYERENAHRLYGLATINGTRGLLILPDNAQLLPDKVSLFSDKENSLNASCENVQTSQINPESAVAYVREGAVFLPCGGTRYGYTTVDVSNFGSYWTATHYDSGSAYFVGINAANGGYVSLSSALYGRHTGRAVRLVRNK